MLDFASGKQSGVGRPEKHLQAATQSPVDLAKISCNNPLDTIQAPFQRVTGHRIIKIRRDDADVHQLGMNQIFAARCAHDFSCKEAKLSGSHDIGIFKT